MVDITTAIVVLACAATDLQDGRIRNVVTYPAMALGAIYALAGVGPTGASSAIGFLVGGLSLYVMFAAGWMGGGDVKLMAAVGALKGFPFILTAMFYSIFFGGVAAAIVLVWRGHTRAVVGDVVTIARRVRYPGFAPDPIVPRGGAFPFGVAIAAGTLTAMAFEYYPMVVSVYSLVVSTAQFECHLP